ncbi:hypothetical protein ACWD2L_00575 [Streptomyces sp. NPDC002754]
MYDYDYRDGIRRGDRAAMSFNYDPRPILRGEHGAGTMYTDAELDAMRCTCPDDLAPFCLIGRPCEA